jgi:hypothetical protein
MFISHASTSELQQKYMPDDMIFPTVLVCLKASNLKAET